MNRILRQAGSLRNKPERARAGHAGGAEHAASFDARRRMFATVLLLLAAAIVGLNLYAPAEPTPLQRLLASALVGLCAVPSMMWAARRPWRQSLMPFVGVLYATWFAVPVFVYREFSGSWWPWPLLDSHAIDYALMLALGGWSALLIGYFALARFATAAWPTVQILPSDDPRLAKAVALAVGLAAAPFLYLDNAAVVARHVGEALLPDALAFPVTLAGQFVVFAMLMLFHLHLRGQLGAAGRLLLAALAVYYTVLGLSTGMVNHGIKAVFALFMAYAVVAPTPTWRGIAFGLATAVAVLFVLLPARMDYRQLIWTHGVGPVKTWRYGNHQFDMKDGEEQTLATPDYDATLRNRMLTFAHNDPDVCRPSAQPPLSATVFVDPVRPDDLPARYRRRGYQQLGFSFADGSVRGGRCVAGVRLPDYPTTTVRTALYRMQRVVQSDVVRSRPADAPGGTGRNPGAPNARDSLANKAVVYARTLGAALDGEHVSRIMDLTPQRLDYLLPLAWLTEHTPDPLPFLRGETYAPLLYKFVPRIVFRDKPPDVGDLGKRYGFVPPNVMNNAKVHQLGEFYVNFGVPGVLAGMFLLGLLYRILHELFHKPSACVATMAAGTHMLTVLALEMESILSVSLGFLTWYAIAVAALALAVRAATRLRRPRPR